MLLGGGPPSLLLVPLSPCGVTPWNQQPFPADPGLPEDSVNFGWKTCIKCVCVCVCASYHHRFSPLGDSCCQGTAVASATQVMAPHAIFQWAKVCHDNLALI